MNNDLNFSRLLRGTLVALFVCAALVLLCYFFVDRPVAFYVHNHGFADDRVLKWLTYLPPLVQTACRCCWRHLQSAGLSGRCSGGRRWWWSPA